MKTKNFVLQLIVLLSFNYEIKSQCNLNDLLIRLNSENPNIRVEAIVDIMVCNLTEAVSGLEARFDIENKLYIADYLLMALDSLHSPNIVSLAHQLLLNAENYDYENSRFSLLNSKLYATQILFKYNDFTTSQIAFDYVDEFGGAYSLIPLEIFDKIIKNVPNLELEAKSRVERILNQCEWEFAKTKSIKILAKNYGSEYQNLILDYFINGETFPIRSTAFDMLFYINFPNLHSLLLDRLPLDDHWTIRLNIADSLLKVWGTPYDFKVVKSYQPSESQKTARSLMGFAIRDFVPPRPSTSTSVSDMVSNLTNTADTLLNYTWLGDLTFVNSLKAKLNQAKTYLLAGDSLSCAVEVKVFQDDVNAVYKDSLNLDPRFVTIEGWKFLYWNAQYILDRLPEPPILIAPKINVITPAMSLVNPGSFTMEVKGTGFNTNSTVYFNGNSRSTTFISDSVLNAQILSTDVSTAGNFPVWVIDGITNSDTVIYKVVSALPQPVRPVLECVRNNGDGTYTAFFGYKNDNDVSVYIPIGNRNKFTPNPQDRGQTRVFLPGRHYKVYTVNFNGSNLVWTLNGRTSTASRTSAPCQ